MEFSVENISGLLIRSKLLTPDEVRAMYQRWQSEGKDRVGSMPHYLKWIVNNDYLTEYQAGLIAHGHAEPHNFVLGQYKILDRLGKGRMAGVYKAAHQSGQVVAIKVLPPSRAKDPQMLGRFQREARLAMQLKHPNVVRSFQVGQTTGLHYLVMEYLEGETLEDVLKRRKKLPVQESVRLIYQALQGLQHIHEKNFVHRDLKPGNLMLVPARAPGEPDTTLTATVKILDIGLGRELFEESAQMALQDLQLTGEGVLLGTPDYLAPEQARDPSGIDIRADIYSLGCVLYHCLAGQPPFPDSNVLNQMVRHATEPPRPIRELAPDVPDGLQQILTFMLAKDPKQRYPTPERVAGSLQVFMVAGAPTRSIDESPQMRKYLTSLETDDKDTARSPDQPELPLPSARPVTPAAPAVGNNIPAATAEKPRHRKKHRKHRHEREAAPAAVPTAAPAGTGAAPAVLPAALPMAGPAALPAAAPAPLPAANLADVDVELVPAPGLGGAPARARTPLLALTWRDWIFLSIGAGAGGAAVLFGWLLTKMF